MANVLKCSYQKIFLLWLNMQVHTLSLMAMQILYSNFAKQHDETSMRTALSGESRKIWSACKSLTYFLSFVIQLLIVLIVFTILQWIRKYKTSIFSIVLDFKLFQIELARICDLLDLPQARRAKYNWCRWKGQTNNLPETILRVR